MKANVKINADFILAKRKALGQNQSEFWREFGLTQSAGSRYESGRNIPPPTRKLIYLRHVVGLTKAQADAIARV